MKKMTMIFAGAVGYVLGTRAGRERYEQIKRQAQRLKNDPRVQEKAREASAAVKENAPVVKEKVADAAGHAKAAAQEKMHGSDKTDGPQANTNASSAPYPQA